MEPRRHIPVALYRMFSASGDLLYIGQSFMPDRRMSQHRLTAAWVQEVASISVTWFPTRREAMLAEAKAIALEKPRHNVTHKREPRQEGQRVSDQNLPNEIAHMERELKEVGHSVADLCREAGINTSTWGRWKNNSFYPRMKVWGDVEAALSRLTKSQKEVSQ